MTFRPFTLLCCALAALTCAFPSAGQNASSSSTQPTRSSHAATRSSRASSTSDSSGYQNPEFGFRYRPILGWVDRTEEMQLPEQTQPGGKPKSGAEASPGKVLVAVFEKPPEVQSEAINPAVVIAQENAASYPGLKSGADYVDPLTQLVKSRGFMPTGDPAEITIDGRALVQCDFKRDDAKRPAFQSTLILFQGGQLVSFTFIASTQEEVEDLMDRLSFQRPVLSKKR